MNEIKFTLSTVILGLVTGNAISYLWHHSPSDFQSTVLMLAMGAAALGYMAYNEVVING